MSRDLQANHETYQANYKLLVSASYFHNRFKKYFQALTGLLIFPLGSAILPYLPYVQTASFIAFISICRPRDLISLPLKKKTKNAQRPSNILYTSSLYRYM